VKISERFTLARKNNEKLFIPFIVAGDPNLSVTGDLLVALEKAGAGIIELGVPFSDPVVDGLTIQLASQRALAKNTSLDEILDLVRHLKKAKSLTVPIVLFSYFNPIFKIGLEVFAKKAEISGIDGVLVVDLPPEEAKEYVKILAAHNLETIFLASPTTTEGRLRLIEENSSGFVYYISRLGVTGAQSGVSGSLEDEMSRLNKFIKKPIAVGFGISTPEQAKVVSQYASAVVVGSALVDLIEKNRDPETAIQAVTDLAIQIVKSIQPGK
jgi:tryptophan synthase alpha chain